MMKEDNRIFYQFRVASSVGGSKHSVLHNGISANDWLSPIGITQKRHIVHDKNNGIIVESLTRRPYTANSVIIIRPTSRSVGLEKYESLTGRSLNSRCNTVVENSIEKNSSAIAVDLSTNNQYVRPTTSYHKGDKVISKPCTGVVKQKGILLKSNGNYSPVIRKDKNVHLDLTIQSLECYKSTSNKENGSHDRFCERIKYNPKTDVSHESNLDTIEGIKRHYIKRAQSAPAMREMRPNTNNSSSNKNYNLYWRAKSAYHRKQVTRDEQRVGQDLYEFRGSLLRPLMFSSEGSIKHSAGCPYRCRGCFRACLVSEDYMESANQKQEPLWRKQRRIKRGPGFSVQLALAKNQPLYKAVHGKTTEPDVTDVKEAWVDVIPKNDAIESFE